MNKVFFILFTFLSSVHLAEGSNNNYLFEHITVEDGLADNKVNSIFQDFRGFIWVGTANGLSVFNGYNFKTYYHNSFDSLTISDNSINCIFEDSKKNLWIGTQKGLNLYIREKDYFLRNFSEIHSVLDFASIIEIVEDKQGLIWIATKWDGLLALKQNKKSVVLFVADTTGKYPLTSKYISDLFVDKDNRMWVATRKGITIIDVNKGATQHLTASNSGLPHNNIYGFYEDIQGNIWIGTRHAGICKYIPSKNEYIKFNYSNSTGNQKTLFGNRARQITSDNKGNLWICTQRALNRYNTSTNTFDYFTPDKDNPFSINDYSVRCLFKDESGILWIGTQSHGLNKLDMNNMKFELYSRLLTKNGENKNNVHALLEDDQKNLWIGTVDGGIFNLNNKTGKLTNYLINPSNAFQNQVKSIVEDKNGNLWVATMGGLFKFDDQKKTFKLYTIPRGDFKKEINVNRIYSLLIDNLGNLWVGTVPSGLYLFDATEEKFTSVNDIVEEKPKRKINLVTSLFEDSKKNIWIGNENLGVFILDSNKKKILSFNFNIFNGIEVYSFHEDKQYNIWIGTNNGIYYYNITKKKLVHYDKIEFPGNQFYGILEDDSQNLWASTNKGIIKFNNNTLNSVIYNIDDGLQGLQFVPRSCFKGKSGKMYFGGLNGFNAFLPHQLSENKYRPPIVLTDFKIGNQSIFPGQKDSPLENQITETKTITLTHKQALAFSIEFAALNYTKSSYNQYKYRLEGLDDIDKGWNYNGTERKAVYTNIHAGTYYFHVIGSNNDNVWNTEGVKLKIKVLPPIWKTWWAYTVYILIILSILFIIFRYFIVRERLKHEKIEKERINALNLMKIKFFTNISHEIKTPLTLIKAPIDELIYNKKTDFNLLKVVQKNTNRLLRLVNQLLDFRRIETGTYKLEECVGDIILFLKNIARSFETVAQLKKIKLTFHSQIESLYVLLDFNKLENIIYNLISNSFKYTPEKGKIDVFVNKNEINTTESSNLNLEIIVEDNGVGISENELAKIFDRFYQTDNTYKSSDPNNYNKGFGIGLSYTKELVDILNGKIYVNSITGTNHGTRFSVEIPIKAVSKPEDIEQVKSSFEEEELMNKVIPFEKDLGANYTKKDIHKVLTDEKPIILLVEDNRDIQYIIKHKIKDKYQVLTADNGAIGLKLAMEVIPDIIISDVMMPELNGLELCDMLKSDTKTSHIPILLLTAFSSEMYKMDGLNKGADEYISKPFNIEELYLRINNIYKTNQRQRENFKKELYFGKELSSKSNPEDQFLQRCMEIIEENISNQNFNIDLFAQRIGMSRTQLYRKFKALSNLSIKEFILDHRLEVAAELLKNSDRIQEVMYQVGISSQSYFTKCFKEKFGVTPKEYCD